VAITPPSAITVAITPLPQPPQTSDPANFDVRADAFVLAEQVFSQQVELGRQQMSENAASAAANAALVQDVSQNVLNAPTTMATSTSSETIGTGTKTFTGLDPSKVLGRGQFVVVSASSAPSNYMLGQVTSPQSGGSVTINVMSTGGGGTFSAWDIALQGVQLVTQRQESRRVAKTAAFTVTAADAATLFDLSGTFTVGFNSATTFGAGFYVDVMNNGVGLITLDGAGSETIAGAVTRTLRPGEAGRIYYISDTALGFLQVSEAVGQRLVSDAPPSDSWLPRNNAALSQSAYPALYSIVGRKYTRFDVHTSGATNIFYAGSGGSSVRYEKIKGRYFAFTSTSAPSAGVTMYGTAFSTNPTQVGNLSLNPSSNSWGRIPIPAASASTNVMAVAIGSQAIVIRDATNTAIPSFSQNGLSGLGRRVAFGGGSLFFRNGADLWGAVDNTSTTAFTQYTSVLPSADTGSAGYDAIGMLYHPGLGVFFTGNVGTRNAWKSSTPTTASSWTSGAFQLPTAARDIAMLADGVTAIMVGVDGSVFSSSDLVVWSFLGVLYTINVSTSWKVWPQSNGIYAISDEYINPYSGADCRVYFGDKSGVFSSDYDYIKDGSVRPLANIAWNDGSNDIYPDFRSLFWDEAALGWVCPGAIGSGAYTYRSSILTTTECNLSTQFTVGRQRAPMVGRGAEYIKAV
jgi:hypothetical protein